MIMMVRFSKNMAEDLDLSREKFLKKYFADMLGLTKQKGYFNDVITEVFDSFVAASDKDPTAAPGADSSISHYYVNGRGYDGCYTGGQLGLDGKLSKGTLDKTLHYDQNSGFRRWDPKKFSEHAAFFPQVLAGDPPIFYLSSLPDLYKSTEYQTLKCFAEMLKSLEDYAKDLGIKDNLTDQANATEQEMTATEPAEKPIGNDSKDTPQKKEASLLDQKRAVVRQLLAALRGTPPVATSSTTVDAHPSTTGSDSSAPANTTTPSTEAAGQTGARYVSQEMQRRLERCHEGLTNSENKKTLETHRHPAWDKFLAFFRSLWMGRNRRELNRQDYNGHGWTGSATRGGELARQLSALCQPKEKLPSAPTASPDEKSSPLMRKSPS